MFRERDFLELVYAYGAADYFDGDRSTPFRYALLLCCCHRFGDAIHHLWMGEKFFPAVHLTVACLHYGLILPFVPLLHNPVDPLVQGAVDRGMIVASSLTPSTIIQTFLQNEELVQHPETCLHYLISLDSKWMDNFVYSDVSLRNALNLKSQETVSDTFESYLKSLPREKLVLIVGDINDATGRPLLSRSQGFLSRYNHDSRRIDALLTRIGRGCVLEEDIEKAVEFFLLAGDYYEAADKLSAVLSKYVMNSHEETLDGGASFISKSVSTTSRTRQLWKEKAKAFFTRLQFTGVHQPGMEEILRFLEVLVGLYDYVDVFQAGKNARNAEEALRVLDNLHILPSRPDDIEQIRSVSHLYLKIIDDLIISVANCIQAAYTLIKGGDEAPVSVFRGTVVTDRDEKLLQLRERSRALYAFTQGNRNVLSKPQTISAVAKLESLLSHGI